MRLPRQYLRSAPLWGLTLLALIFWGTFNYLQHQAWNTSSHYTEARPNGEFEDRALHSKPLPSVYLDNDSLYWLHHASEALKGRSWRPRHTDWDNVPEGRPNHWSSPLLWAMGGTARLASLFTSRSAVELLSVTSPWISPILFALLLCATAHILTHRFRPWIAGLLVLSLATLPPIIRSFSVLHIDHHGLIDIPALWMLLFLLFGVVGRSNSNGKDTLASERTRRTWFLASGIMGGVGLWLQASHQLILIAGTLSALFLWVLFSRPALPSSSNIMGSDLPSPDLWRLWASSGALISLAAYALEYAPYHLGMQLEVNHPLYALSWWGATEAILAIRRSRQERHWTRPRLAIIAGGFFPALVTILLIRHGPEQWFTVSGPFLQRIHEQIKEFQPLLKTLDGFNPLLVFLLFNSLPLIALYGLYLWGSKKISAQVRLGLQIALFSLLPAGVLCLQHTRYSSLLAATMWGMAVMVFLATAHVSLSKKQKWMLPALLCVGCATSLLLTLSPLLNTQVPFMPVARWVPQMLRRDIARELSMLPGFSESYILCDYNIAPHLQAFAGARTTGGLYWENAKGLEAAAAFFTETDERKALQLLQERKIGWVVYKATPRAPATWLYAQYGPPPYPNIHHTMAFRLSTSNRVPRWLEHIPPEQIPLSTKAFFRVYRVE